MTAGQALVVWELVVDEWNLDKNAEAQDVHWAAVDNDGSTDGGDNAFGDAAVAGEGNDLDLDLDAEAGAGKALLPEKPSVAVAVQKDLVSVH